jgi:hypothetical protein
MKKSRLLLFLPCLLLAIGFSYGQQSYYWSQKKKVPLQIDSTSLLVDFKPNANKKRVISQSFAENGITNTSELPSPNRVIVNLKTKVSRAKYLSLRKTQPEIQNATFNFKVGQTQPLSITGDIVLKPKKATDIAQVLALARGELILVSQTEYQTFVLQSTNIGRTLALANQIYESGLVEWCHPDFIAPIVKYQNDPLYAEQYYLNNTGQLGGIANIDINAPEAWAISGGINNVRVAVLDDGVEAHEDLQNRLLPGFDPRIAANPGAPRAAVAGHGQACGGMIAANRNNTLGVAGIAGCTQIVPVNIFPPPGEAGYTTNEVAAAINWAWNQGQAAVLSNSWGFPGNCTQTSIGFDAIIQAITNARTQGRGGRGSVVVFASGNDGGCVTFPGNVNGVVTVGAISNRGDLWSYSNRGAEMDLVAPSGNVNSLGDVRTTDRTGANGYEAGNYTSTFGGTSAACPQVAAVAAMILSVSPLLNEGDVANTLRSTATDMGTAGFDNNFGAGRLNAQAAINAALNIAGANVICASPAQAYTIAAQPAGTVINWTASPASLFTASTAAGNTFTTAGVGNGSGTISVTITGNCGNTTLTRRVTIGTPAPTGISGPSYDLCYSRTSTRRQGTYSVSNPLVGLTYEWQIVNSGGGVELTGGGTSFTVNALWLYEGTFRIQVRSSSCGTTSAWFSSNLFVRSCTTALTSVGVYPNPGDQVIRIAVSSDGPDGAVTAGEPAAAGADQAFPEYEIKVYDQYSQLKLTATTQRGNTELDTRALPNGVYFMHVRQGQEFIRKQIVIRH